MKVKKILIRKDKKYYWTEGDLHTTAGIVKAKDIEKSKGKVKAHSGKEFDVLDANFIDNLEKIKRGPAVMTKKDIGLILTKTGIDKGSVVVEAGTGCGVLTAYLANFVKKVYSYEKNKDNFNMAKKNLEMLDVKNVELKNKDVEEMDEKDVDLVVLDVPEPWKVLKNVKLKSGKFLVAYLPTINQVDELMKESRDFFEKEVIELLEREWYVEKQRVRPKSQMIGHTGFLVFMRR